MSPIRRSLQLVDSLSNLGRIKVGFATSDRVHVDQHFGSAVSLVAFSLDAEGAQLVSIGQFGELAEDGNEGKLAAKLQWLRGCVAVYCCACGGSAVRQLLSAGVRPLKVSSGTRIDTQVAELVEDVRTGPTGWIAQALQAQQRVDDTSRFAALGEEAWEE